MKSFAELRTDVMVVEPTGVRAGYAPNENRLIIQLLLPGDTIVTYGLAPETAYHLAHQIAEIGEQLADQRKPH